MHLPQLLGALAGAGGSDGNGQCEYRCPSGKKPKPRKGHVPQSNGCGSYGMQVWVCVCGCATFLDCSSGFQLAHLTSLTAPSSCSRSLHGGA